MNIERLAHILRDAARQEIMPRFRQLEESSVEAKSHPYDLVTEADKRAEIAITQAISQASPHVNVIGEEAVAADPGLLSQSLEEGTTIFIDPVDGTWNFASGLPLFAVMAAVVERGETVSGVIYDPVGDDWMMAEKGCGTWYVRPDGKRARQKFAHAVPLQEMGGVASTSYLSQGVRSTVLGNLAKVQMFAGYRCAGHEYRLGAGGHLHFMMFNKLMPWDHLAGALMMAEAGAHVARFDGSAYRPEHHDGGLLIAPDAESWKVLRQTVFTV
ncbi:inositol monophosphatase family protein [Pelagibacterium xiamenense]|uniref:inositol monophosphatase family protein n=1 Tax=Pelagibacterium xiamenense TaxID=2901140 RepID=UPI001E371011|nr:inositol monophosphatase family protein [Pelagibacterium xiamenense]MCD7059974.1 inositol monophosphatase [Pelagibacterium xiamenense]